MTTKLLAEQLVDAESEFVKRRHLAAAAQYIQYWAEIAKVVLINSPRASLFINWEMYQTCLGEQENDKFDLKSFLLYCKAFWEDHQTRHNSTSCALTVAVCWLKWSGEEEGGKWDKLWWLRTSLGDILPGRAPRFGNKVRNINTPGQDPSSDDLLPSRWWCCYHVKNWTK